MHEGKEESETHEMQAEFSILVARDPRQDNGMQMLLTLINGVHFFPFLFICPCQA